MKRRRAAMALIPVVSVVTLAGGLIATAGPAAAAVTAVTGSAYGYYGNITFFGTPQPPTGPTPVVTLPASGSSTPITATAPSGKVKYSPATFFTSDRIDVSTQGTPAVGAVASSAKVVNINKAADPDSGSEIFTADSVINICTASQSGLRGAPTFTNATLQTDNGDDTHPQVNVAIPAHPAPNTLINGVLRFPSGQDTFRVVFNEQVVNPDGSLTKNAVHEYLDGPGAVGNVIIGQVVCGVTPASTIIRNPLTDFDGNGVADIAILRPSTSTWFVNGGATRQWGATGDVTVPGDYDGDGKADQAIFRPATGLWAIHKSGGGADTFVTYGGVSGDIPVPGDYDGDGKTDIAVFRPAFGLWYVHRSSDNTDVPTTFGVAGDLPVPADYTGDGKTDIAVVRPSDGNWFVHPSGGGADTVLSYGTTGDVPIPGDYDGDGKADVAIFRPSTGLWSIRNSATGTDAAVTYGINTDVPVPVDYDGDGRFDIAVFRPSSGAWYVHQSFTGTDAITTFGINTDKTIQLLPSVRTALSY